MSNTDGGHPFFNTELCGSHSTYERQRLKIEVTSFTRNITIPSHGDQTTDDEEEETKHP
jgi:hypothetical protein